MTHFCDSYDIITLRLGTELWFLLSVAQTTCLGIHALKIAGLRVLAFGKVWRAFFNTLVGVLIHLVAYGYTGVTSVDPTPKLVSLKHNSLRQSASEDSPAFSISTQ